MYVADWGMGGWGSKTEKLGRVYAVTYTGEMKTRARGKDSDPIDRQIQALAHPSFNERCRAQQALAGKGREALTAATTALADPGTDPVAARHLVWAVDGIAGGTPGATGPLTAALTSRVADVRAQAARALGERGVKDAVAPLVALLADREPSVRLQAVIALGRIGGAEAVPGLVTLAGSEDDFLAFSARTALKRIGAWAEAAKGLDSADPKVRDGVLLAMELVYQAEAVSALARFAADPSRAPSERARALTLLAQGHRKPVPWDGKWWGTQPARSSPPVRSIDWEGTPRVLSAVRERLNDPAAPVRLAAVSAVKETGDPAALAVLRTRFAAETDAPVRGEMARVLGSLRDRESLPMLLAAVRDRAAPGPVRDEALAAVEAIGSDEALKGLLGLLTDDAVGAGKQPRVIAALARFKTGGASDALLKALKDPAPSVRAAAAESLGQAGTAKAAGKALRDLLSDPAVEVRKAAAVALGVLKDRPSVAALIEAAGKADTGYEAALALTRIPDPGALGVYLRGLTDKSPDLRKASSEAIGAVRDEVTPVLETLAARKELSSAVLPELRKVFTRVRPVPTWQTLGPFPIKTEPPFAVSGPIDPKAKFPGYQDEPLTWKTVKAVDGKGQIDLAKIYGSADDLAAFGYVGVNSQVERRATFAVGSDDTLTVWVNGETVYDFQDRRGFNPEAAQFDVPLNKGVNRVVIKCGNRGGPWQFSLAVSYSSDHAFLRGPAPGAFDPEAYRKFARSARGKAAHGRELFADLKGLACVKCHAVGGQGGAVGPELTSVGAKYPRDEIITAVLYPSAKISSGYEPVVIALTDGRVVTGIIKGETADAVAVEDADAKRQTIPKADIDERKASPVSLMPNGLAEGLSRQDFADLVAYLETLRDKDVNPAKAGASGGR